MAKVVGKVCQRDERQEFIVEWKIQQYFGLSVKVDKQYRSPSFSFVNAYWYLCVYPNGAKVHKSEGHLDVFLNRESSGPPISLDYTLGLKTVDEDTEYLQDLTYIFEESDGYGNPEFLSRSKLLERKYELAPGNAVTVVCRLKYPANFKATGLTTAVTTTCSYCRATVDDNEDMSYHLQECEFLTECPRCDCVIALKNLHDHRCQRRGAEGFRKTVITKCSFCKITLDAHENIASHHQKCNEFPIQCPKCDNVVALKNWHIHKCQMMRTEATEKLCSDFKSMMLSGEHSDTTINVKGEEFRLHRNVMASRNPYFHSMFNCSMKENNTGIVTINDCEPDVFRSFIHFVYTGSVDKLTLENVCDLYELADKYQEDQLKSECLNFMMDTLSVDNFCDFTVLAFRHDEKELLENAIKVFVSNTKAIIRSVKWQNLLLKYPIQANELHIKAFD